MEILYSFFLFSAFFAAAAAAGQADPSYRPALAMENSAAWRKFDLFSSIFNVNATSWWPKPETYIRHVEGNGIATVTVPRGWMGGVTLRAVKGRHGNGLCGLNFLGFSY